MENWKLRKKPIKYLEKQSIRYDEWQMKQISIFLAVVLLKIEKYPKTLGSLLINPMNPIYTNKYAHLTVV